MRSGREDDCHRDPAPASYNKPSKGARRRNGCPNTPTEESLNEVQTLLSPFSSWKGHATTMDPVGARHAASGHDHNRASPEGVATSNTFPLALSASIKRVGDVHLEGVYDKIKTADRRLSSRPPTLTETEPHDHLLAHVAPSFPLLSAPSLMRLGIWSIKEQELFWKQHLCENLPNQSQCDLLICYYFENLNWIFQSIHVPSFRKDYAIFWNADVTEVNLIWLSLLYTIISLSALYIPISAMGIVGISSNSIRDLAHVWHSASRQALHAGGFESKPSLTQLQTFSITQLYWYATNNVEILNSALAQAVRNAQAIGLDKDTEPSTSLESEMRHRAWWDLCDSDTFQSICLSRSPLIQARLSMVPIPLNCNDIDITEISICPRSIDQPTEMSQNVFRAKIFKIFNKLYFDDGAHVLSYDFVKSIDVEIEAVLQEFPWYFRIENGVCATLPPSLDFVLWQFHILHTCICTQRIRMYREFLHPHVGDAWTNCVKAAEDAFIVYRNLRNNAGNDFKQSQKFLGQAYQVFSVAVAIATLLIIEQSFPSAGLRNEIEMAIMDLGYLDTKETTVSLAADGRKILARMLLIHDQRCASPTHEPEDLVTGISAVSGGERTARSFLKKCNIRAILNPASEADAKLFPVPYQTNSSMTSPHATDIYRQEDMLVNEAVAIQPGYDILQTASTVPLDSLDWWPSGSFTSYMDYAA